MNLQDMKNLPPEKQKKLFESLTAVRKKAKVVSYSAMYGVGKTKLARSSGMTEEEAEKLLRAFWDLNWSVTEIASKAEVRTVAGQKWVWNPVSQFWYTLRYDKDRWSTLNQGTGAYCFDTWLGYCMSRGVMPCGQFHDEFIAPLDEGNEEATEEVLRWAIGKVNDKLKLNVDLGIDVQFGGRYADIH